jgi:hypothetical protein
MSDEREQQIRERAYAVWEEEGCPDGRDREHWLQAEAEIVAEDPAVSGPAETVAQKVSEKSDPAPSRGRAA